MNQNRRQPRQLGRGECGYGGGMRPPARDFHDTPKGRNRNNILRVPCGGGYRVIRKKVGES